VPVAVAVRNKAWMAPALADCLRRHLAVWVLPDQAWMPSPLSLVRRPGLDVVTGPFAYVRLLGDREAVDALTKTLDHIVIDRAEQVATGQVPGPVRVRRVDLAGGDEGDVGDLARQPRDGHAACPAADQRDVDALGGAHRTRWAEAALTEAAAAVRLTRLMN
jgi:hypothetical protein